MSLFRSVELAKISFAPGSREKGSWMEGARSEPVPFKGTWQSAGGQTLQLLPEGKRSREAYKVFAPIELDFTADDDNGVSGDLVVWEGKEYEVSAAVKWDNGLIPHWELVCTRIKGSANV
jgi:hypothetical protein